MTRTHIIFIEINHLYWGKYSGLESAVITSKRMENGWGGIYIRTYYPTPSSLRRVLRLMEAKNDPPS